MKKNQEKEEEVVGGGEGGGEKRLRSAPEFQGKYAQEGAGGLTHRTALLKVSEAKETLATHVKIWKRRFYSEPLQTVQPPPAARFYQRAQPQHCRQRAKGSR